jgi:hypothetical protein
MVRQHPPGEKPSIVVMFAEPPSVVGIAGGQMVGGALGAAAVVLADCMDTPSPSPGNSRGACGLRVAEKALVADVPVENEDMEDSVDVGTPRGSVPVFTLV